MSSKENSKIKNVFKESYNVSIRTLVGAVNYFEDNPPMFDETGFDNFFNLSIKSWEDIEGIKRELKKYGIEVKEEMRNIDMLVVDEPGIPL